MDETTLARVALSHLVEPGNRILGRLVHEAGPVAVLDQLVRGLAPKKLQKVAAARLAELDPVRTAEEAVAHTVRLGARLLTPEEAEWPARLADLRDVDSPDDENTMPPLCLWVRGHGHLAELLDRAVSVVGARAATSYGKHVATEFGYGLADRGWTVVSGGAYGIDSAAHRGALAAGGVTVAVLASGVDVAYPVGNTNLFERIVEEGLLVSEWPPGARPQRHRFLVRNRVIAAATRGTVIVEAAARSGAKQTARRALDLGRPLMAVPGPVTSAMSVGAHSFLREERARLVTRAADVIEEVGRIGEELAMPVRGPETIRDGLDPMSAQVLDAVPRRAVPLERIAAEAGIAPTDARRSLPVLTLLGLVEQTAGGYRLTDRARVRVPAASPPRVR